MKSTETKWTRTEVLKDNLLANFISNAIASERQDREWRVKLITPATVARAEILDFVNNPTQFSELDQRLCHICERAREIHNEQETIEDLSDSRLRALAVSILRQISETTPARLETFKAEVEREIAYEYPDPEAVQQIANTLLGAMLRQAGLGPDRGISYDASWLTSASGRTLGKRTRLVLDPVFACDEQVNGMAAPRWSPDRLASRPRLAHALSAFLSSPETVFVVIGASGTGKSWAISDWVSRELAGRVRVQIPAGEIERHKDLGELIAGQLGQFAPTGWNGAMFLNRLNAAATIDGQGPLIVVVDDLKVMHGNIHLMRQDLKRLADECLAIGAKLVLTCQDASWKILRPLEALMAADPGRIFRIADVPDNPLEESRFVGSRHGSNSDSAENSLDVGTGGTWLPARPPPADYSFFLSDLSDDELVDVLQIRLSQHPSDAVTGHLLSPNFRALRNLYLLDLYLDTYGSQLGKQSSTPAPVDVDALLDLRLERALDQIASELGTDIGEVRHALNAFAEQFWMERPTGVASTTTARILDDVLQVGSGQRVIAAFRSKGIVSATSPITFAEPALAERWFARWIGEALLNDLTPLAGLRPEDDSGVVAAVLRGVVEDPVALAEELLARDSRWSPAVASGLAQGLLRDTRPLALLSILAQPNDVGILSQAACEALGNLAARDRIAWKWVAQRFLGDRFQERFEGANALAAAVNLDPVRVGAAVRLRLSRAAALDTKDRKQQKERDRLLRGALVPMLNLNSRSASKVASRLLDEYAGLAGDRITDANEAFSREVDETRGRIALTSGSATISQLQEELESEQALMRFRAARAMRAVAVERPDLVGRTISTAIGVETNTDVANQLLWSAFKVTETHSDELLGALTARRERSLNYEPETVGQIASLLSKLVDYQPETVAALLPSSLESFEPAIAALHSEVLAFAWWRVAERLERSRQHLIALAEQDFTSFPQDYRPFGTRGIAYAQLGLICLDAEIPSSDLVGWHSLYPNLHDQFLFVWDQEFVGRNSQTLAK